MSVTSRGYGWWQADDDKWYPPERHPNYRPAVMPTAVRPAAVGTNGMAIASLVLGILWLYWVGSVLALIFGYTARAQIRQTGESGGGMAVAGIVLGWIGVGTLLIVLCIMLVAAGGADT